MQRNWNSWATGGNVKWCSHCGTWQLLKKLKIELSYDPAILLVGIYPKELKVQIELVLPTVLSIKAILTNHEFIENLWLCGLFSQIIGNELSIKSAWGP